VTDEPLVLLTDPPTHPGVRVVTLNRPAKLNAFDSALYGAAAAALRDASSDDAVRVVVLTGAGRGFSAGQDLGEMASLREGSATGSAFPEFVDALTSFEKPLIAAVNGIAVGIGMTMLPHCDIVLVDATARMRVPFTELGVPPEAASSYLFPLTVGRQRAAEILFTSDWVDADQAVADGLALRSCAAGTVVDEALALAAHIARHPLVALVASKRALLDTRRDAIERARRLEDAAFAEIFASFQP
jgi:enoyl-CoA hydratase/carnithine racemase